MNNLLTAKELKEQGSLVDLLSRLGYQPVPKRGREKMYISMLRDNDTQPSFSVNDDLGVWFDHGAGKGGNIIDFGLAYWKNLGFNEVVKKIQEVCSIAPTEQRVPRPRKPVKVQHVVERVKPIGVHPAITDYLKSRGVFDVAKFYLSEVYYYIEDENDVRKHYFAAGWLNENNSWEVRNRYFKGCMGHKGITIIPGHPKKAAVFEGFIDFLSWRFDNPDADHSIIVLNTLTLLQQGITKAKAFSSLDIYFDRDKAGKLASRDFIKALPYATDRSVIYEGFNDYNDKIKAQVKMPAATQNNKTDFFANVKVPFER
ncbi:toprim domain-containing protein [Mucilaginibacter sp. KACC 22773]|uniref:toprim domain-containing protein n=1 Tax=Mucilaginibacter sp. KACC 22773 TaxID=3025671 RepID=UPI002365811C|nr:toprim domain-containing protein [Mucilaginibacter sp. KACC 22773]WDF77065.1 toprim domain-containing protein [Mucilaginibacter sp. KACC 22773]